MKTLLTLTFTSSLLLGACTAPPPEDFSTPKGAFEYCRFAIVRENEEMLRKCLSSNMVATYDSEGLKSLDKILIAITNCGGIGREVTGESEYHPFLGTRDPNVKYMLFKPKPSCHTSMRMVKEGDAWKFDQEE